MAKAPGSNPDLIRPFYRAAFSGRFIGVAALTLGALVLWGARQSAGGGAADVSTLEVIFALMFIVPGVLYLALATWVMRQRRWAVVVTLALAMLDMMLLGVLFVSSWGMPFAWRLCPVAGLFVVALAVMTMFLQRSLEALKRLGT